MSHPALGSVNHGELAASTNAKGELYLLDSYYPIEIALEKQDTPMQYGQLGHIYLKGRVKSKFRMVYDHLAEIFWRESGA